jgi:formylmethanofuran dehydrogenase subunit A
LRQFTARNFSRPRKWVISETDFNGSGIVPYRYSSTDFYNVVQWAVGLELFLLIDDPWRVFFTTDHPNGAPFTAYPELFALLMDRQVRSNAIAALPKRALAMTGLASIGREYTLAEIAIMTRAAPARLLGLADRGHLGRGARADIAVYRRREDKAEMFRHAAVTVKGGAIVVRDGTVIARPEGRALVVKPGAGSAISRRMERYYDTTFGLSPRFFHVDAAALGRPDPFLEVACRS